MVSPAWCVKRVVKKVRVRLDPKDAVAAADAGGAGTHRFQYRAAIDGLQKCVELGAGASQLDGVVLVSDVDDAAAEDVSRAFHLLAILSHRARLDQHQLALDV